MSDNQISKNAQIKKLARELVRGSIIEDASSRFVEMILKEAHDSRIKPLHDRIEKLEAKLVKAMQHVSEYSNDPHLVRWARRNLAELTGGNE